MKYEEWLEYINYLAKFNDKDKLDIMKRQEVDINIQDILEPKLENLVYVKLNSTIKKILRDLTNMFGDVNFLDLSLVNFKKEINFIIDICSLRQISDELKSKLIIKIKDDTSKVYDILIREANRVDQNGILSMVIKNNMIKWGE